MSLTLRREGQSLGRRYGRWINTLIKEWNMNTSLAIALAAAAAASVLFFGALTSLTSGAAVAHTSVP
jgi:hypothetical protein